MDTTEKSLAILYRHIPPERVLQRVCKQVRMPLWTAPREDRKIFLSYAETMLYGYSADEQALAFTQLERLTKETSARWGVPRSVFVPLLDFGEKTLTSRGGEPLCRFSRILPWREMYLLLGQDLIVCAYLACIDRCAQVKREYFAWPAILRTDQNRLRLLLENGIAENHYHLKGSAHSFSLTWCELMNNITMTDVLSEQFPVFLQPVTVRDAADGVRSTKDRVLLAALIRSILFRALHRSAFFSEQPGAPRTPFSSAREFQEAYDAPFSVRSTLYDTVQLLRLCYGAQVPQPDGTTLCLDYALDPVSFREAADSPFRSMIGERRFLYDCFTACFERTFTAFEQDLFYLYLLLKTAFRAEMIQSNGQTGFQNFDWHQERKELAWQGGCQWEAYRMSINAPLHTQHVTSLEARLTPAKTPRGIWDKVYECDEAKHFCDRTHGGEPPRRSNAAIDAELCAEKFLEEPHFYVIHFVKQPDKTPDRLVRETGVESVLYCRHYSLRNDVRERAMALARALSQSPYLCCRIRGIDGCANEVDCRPEVFGTAFRFLRNFQPEDFGGNLPFFASPGHRLSVTYHAGEDFYDVADGLRAIDETIRFLDYRRGDRIGHALALGVDPAIHYQKKSMCSILPRQNYLDNLVWLIYRGRELGVRIDPQQYGIMQQQAQYLLREIYKTVFSERPVTLQDYYSSMLLRGDLPELYASGQFDRSLLCQNFYSAWGILKDRRSKEPLESYRQSSDIARLYYAYHYDQTAKTEGAKTISVDITPDYIALVREVQDAMQWYLERRGVIVECNPSSNVLIGTFGNYSHHPVMRFNNEGLDALEDRRRNCPQMHVCINTDDLGVFDTSLEFEYALLMGSLSAQNDGEAHPRYTTNSILSYLRNLQEMGRQAVFAPPQLPT